MLEWFQQAVQKAYIAPGKARFYTRLPASKDGQAKLCAQLVLEDGRGQAALLLGTSQLMGK